MSFILSTVSSIQDSILFVEPEWHFLFLGMMLLQTFLLVWLMIHLRHASTPVLASLVDTLRKEQDILRHNMSRMVAESLDDRKRFLDSDGRIWEELRRLNARLDEMRCPIGADCPLNKDMEKRG